MSQITEIIPYGGLEYPDSKVHGANMGPTWVLSAPDGPHVGSTTIAIRVVNIITDDDLVTQGAKAWTATMLTYVMSVGNNLDSKHQSFFFQNTQVIKVDWITLTHIYEVWQTLYGLTYLNLISIITLSI